MILRGAGFGLVLLALLGSVGCVTLKPAARVPGADALTLEGVPLTEFGAQTCGPASLAAVLSYWGREVSIEELDESLPKAKNGGVLSLDLLLAARELGFGAELIRGDREVIHENLEAGRPLILMLQILDGVGESRDLYHYIIVDGLDLVGDLLRVQYGDGKARWVSYERLSRAWDDTDFATLILWPDGDPFSEEGLIRYAVALEVDGQFEDAARIYRRLLTDRPDLVLAWVNLGNVLAAQGLHSEAERSYASALERDPDNVDALNNLAWSRLTTGGDLEGARELALRATAQIRPDPYLALDTLARIELELGHCDAAAEAFGLALETAPQGSSARRQILEGLAEVERDCRRLDFGIEQVGRTDQNITTFGLGYTWASGEHHSVNVTVRFVDPEGLGEVEENQGFAFADTVLNHSWSGNCRIEARPWLPNRFGSGLGLVAPTGNVAKGAGIDMWVVTPYLGLVRAVTRRLYAISDKWWLFYRPTVLYDLELEETILFNLLQLGREIGKRHGVGLEFGSLSDEVYSQVVGFRSDYNYRLTLRAHVGFK